MIEKKNNELELRTISKTVRLSKSEFDLLNIRAKKHGLGLCAYIRSTALTSDDTRLPKIRNEAISQVQKIGNNWNQIAHYLNVAKKSGGTVDNIKLLQEFEAIGKRLDDVMNLLIIKK